MPRHSKQDYVDTAQILRSAYNIFEHHAERTVLVHIAAAYAELYRQDNPSFDVERFHQAAFGRPKKPVRATDPQGYT